MDFELSDEQRALATSVRDFCRAEIVPHAKRWDDTEHFPIELVPKLAELGLMGMQISPEYGGAGMSFSDYVLLIEELARHDGSVCLTVASHNSLCSGHINGFGSDEQKRRYLPDLTSAKKLGAWCLTEPGSGSDAGGARTRAIKKGDRWIINGSKTFITQGSVAGTYVVLASTTPEAKQKGLTAFIVEKGWKGLRVGRHLEKMGLRASDTTEVIFEELEVPDENRIGEVDHGFTQTLRILEKGRVAIASMAVGLGRGALKKTTVYAKQRSQFGQAIANFQAIQFMLANMAMELEGARLLVRRAAWLQDQGRRIPQEASMAKLWAAQAGRRACMDAIQILGGYGYTREFPVERYLRDVKLCEIGEGTNEVQRMLISRQLFAGA